VVEDTLRIVLDRLITPEAQTNSAVPADSPELPEAAVEHPQTLRNQSRERSEADTGRECDPAPLPRCCAACNGKNSYEVLWTGTIKSGESVPEQSQKQTRSKPIRSAAPAQVSNALRERVHHQFLTL